MASAAPGQGKAPHAESGGFSRGGREDLVLIEANVALDAGRSSLAFRDLKSLAGNELQGTHKEEYL